MDRQLENINIESLDYYCNYYDIGIFLSQEKCDGGYLVIDMINNKRYIHGYHLSSYEQRCRFCGKTCPDVSFRSKAHIVPESLGAKSLFADNYECDFCNKNIFNKYENDLNKLLSPFLVINGVKGKNGYKKHKSFDKKSFIAFEDDIIKIAETTDSNNKTNIDEKEKSFTLTVDIPSFSPKNIYKIISKIAVELLDENRAKDYSIIANYSIHNTTLGFEYFIFCFYPGINLEEITLMGYFLKDNQNPILPEYTFLLFSGNYSIQIPLYSDEQIKKLNGKTISFDCLPVPTPFDNTEFGDKYIKVYKAYKDEEVEKHKLHIKCKYDSVEVS